MWIGFTRRKRKWVPNVSRKIDTVKNATASSFFLVSKRRHSCFRKIQSEISGQEVNGREMSFPKLMPVLEKENEGWRTNGARYQKALRELIMLQKLIAKTLRRGFGHPATPVTESFPILRSAFLLIIAKGNSCRGI